MYIICDISAGWREQNIELVFLTAYVIEICWIIPAMISYFSNRLEFLLDCIATAKSEQKEKQIRCKGKFFFDRYTRLLGITICVLFVLVTGFVALACIIIFRTLGRSLGPLWLEVLLWCIPVIAPTILIIAVVLLMIKSRPLLRLLDLSHKRGETCPLLKNRAANLWNRFKRIIARIIN